MPKCNFRRILHLVYIHCNMVTPFRALLLLFYVACAVLVLMVLSPGEIPLSQELSLKVFTFQDLVGNHHPPTAEHTRQMQALNAISQRIDSLMRQKINRDSVFFSDSMAAPQPAKARRITRELLETLPETVHRIQFPDSLNPLQLDKFFGALAELSYKPQLVRIVHYGDSQIEGDRISDYMRMRLQKRFGGCGVGIVPFLELQASRSTLATEATNNWFKYSVYGHNKANKTGHYGILAAAYRFSPLELKDSLAETEKTWRATSYFRPTHYSNEFSSATEIQNIKLIYSSPFSKVIARIRVEGQERDTTLDLVLRQEQQATVAEQAISGRFQQLSVSLESGKGSEFFGLALDCNQGIALDNVAMRGSSGIEFSKMNAQWLRRQYELLNVKLIILQFGVNVVPNVLEDYTFYEQMLYNQLRFLKSVAPQADILVVSLSDMARRSGVGYASYPNVPRIRDAQRRAAFRAGCAFWDLYQAMGGEGSIVSWVHNKPPLATKDYTHFTPRGARLVGEMLYNALMKEYEQYKIRKKLVQ